MIPTKSLTGQIGNNAAAFLILMLSSCTHYYYMPNSQNIPLFEGRNEARLSVKAATGDEVNATEVQAAYSPVNHLGVMLNYMSARGGASGEDNGNGRLVEAGA